MLRTTALSVAALLGALLVTPTSVSAAGETCHGSAATIVGATRPSGSLVGTEGPDVIVTDGAKRVDAGGGDDLVCVTRKTYNVVVNAGAGNDVVDASASVTGLQTDLGAGSDRYVGWSGYDVVRAGSVDELLKDIDMERDVIDTGPGGGDLVDSGQDGAPNADEIHMDRGLLRWSGAPAAGGVLDGGAGSTLELTFGADDHLTIDAVTGSVAVTGRDTLALSGFTSFVVGGYEPAGSFDFRGAGADETLRLSARASARTTVAMGGGDDRMVLDIGARVPSRASYDAGDGRDLLKVVAPGTVVGVDLAAARITTGREGRRLAPVSGFEDARVMGREVDVRGTSTPNDIAVHACRSTVRARGGADSVSDFRSLRLGCRTPRGRWFGNGGDDVLRGTNGPDRLVGGAGRDRAIGSGGRDVCRAEVRRTCELRR